MEQPEDAVPSSSGGEGCPDSVPIGAITWAAPLDWLEEILPGSPVLENLRRSLPRPSSRLNAQTPVAVQTPTLVGTYGSPPFEVKTPILQGAGATPFFSASMGPLLFHASLDVGMNRAEQTAVSTQGAHTSTPISLTSVAVSTFPSKVSVAGESTLLAEEVPIFQPDTFTGLPVSVASPTSFKSLSKLQEVGGNVMEDASSLQQDESGTSSPVSTASASVWMSPINPSEVGTSVHTEEKAPLLDTGVSAAISMASAELRVSSPNVPEAGTIMAKFSDFRPEECTDTLLSLALAATPTEVGSGTSKEEETLIVQRDKCTTVSVAFPEISESKSELLEICRNPLKEETASILELEEGTDVPFIDAKVSPPPPPNVPEIGPGASILQKQNPSTPFAMASAAASLSPMNSEAGEGTATEVTTPALCLLGCQCHSAWTSPLSLLEVKEADGSMEERDPSCKPGTSDYTIAGPGASTKIWATPSHILASGLEVMSSVVLQTHKGTRTNPVSVASIATWMTPPSLLGVGVNTSPAEKAATKDNTAETDSLLWRCSRDELRGLSRSELEGRLESTLIIMEALSHQMRACQDFQPSAAPTHLAGQRDAGTQTPISDPKEEEQLYHHLYEELRGRYQALLRSRESEKDLAQRLAIAKGEMKTWMSDSGTLLETVDASYLRIQEDRRSLALQQKQLADLFSLCQDKLQRSGQEQAKMKEEVEKALRTKEAAESVLDSVRNHAGTRIECLEQSLESQKHLLTLLQEANRYMSDLSLEYNRAEEEMDRRAMTLRESWIQMRHDNERFTSMVTQCLLATKKEAAEVAAAQEEVAQHQEVCRKLEERTLELLEALRRMDQLTEAKDSLERDLTDALQRANVVERENEELRQEKGGLSQQLTEMQDLIRKLDETVARLSQEKAVAEQERDTAQQDAREASDCREFMEQETQITRRQLAETEEELKWMLATLRERSTQLEDLKDAHRTLQQEQEALRADLAASRAEIQSTRVSMEGFSQSLLEMKGVHSQFLEMVDFLRAAMRGEASDVAQKSLLYTPGRPTPSRMRSSFVESVLKAVADKDLRTPGLLSETTAFTKTTPVRPPTPSEVHRDFCTCIQDLCDVATRLRHLISQRQEAVMEEAQRLEAEILQQKQNLEDSEHQLQLEREAGSANLAKLNKALHMRMQNEKDLQKLMRQQEERLRMFSDQSREVALLKEEVSQLKYGLQKSETEVATLWQELRATKPSEEDETRGKIWLRQEVGKLRDLLLQKDDERVELQSKYQGQVRLLESQLHQAKQALKKHEKTAMEVKEVLSTLPQDLSAASEVRRLLELLP
ncbi:sperm-associated antigen 5 [Sceloporus undulatus]|uniref:sperm-associated antigen 5 n=1 Tax=Sceloporus undulatus TaxID=8520 RepID=UPI001C4C1207|nr:sperm-associated antigen 5 [Sceloporus undulatus]